MLIEKKGNITIVTQETGDIITLVKKLTDRYEEFVNDNIIVTLFSIKDVKASQLSEFLQLSNTHRKAKHSFVIVTENVSIDEVSEDLVVVPTTQEAFDLIEMEEIERDLGF